MPLHIDRCVSQVERIVCVILVFITHHMGSHTLSSGDSGRELGVGDAEPVFGSRVWMAVYGDCVWFCRQACHRQWCEELGCEYDLGMADKPVLDSGGLVSGECDLCAAVILPHMAVWKRDTCGEDDHGVAGS